MAKTSRKKVTDLKFDANNINSGTVFGNSLLERSIREVGLGRSILTDKNGVIIAGNQTAQKASELGFNEVIEVETDGRQLVVVKRTDLDINSAMGVKAKILDNTVSEHNYEENIEVSEAICEEFQIDPADYGLDSEQEPDTEKVSFGAAKHTIKIQLPNKKQLSLCEKEIAALLQKKYPEALITVKGK